MSDPSVISDPGVRNDGRVSSSGQPGWPAQLPRSPAGACRPQLVVSWGQQAPAEVRVYML
eukprot:NODE_5790_length_676_cov_6.141946_g4899_i0.p3 GENE.NODE_5790_length_676_cov_6.141946_g4899_i0~~NODE_5790_length_676_cov_6.141946_g4899_i0.p3  ORF type:complete len:60 (-),score=7.74 NODE_5790_length_676_cov_6.141946_g4899_i0:336-515(-)